METREVLIEDVHAYQSKRDHGNIRFEVWGRPRDDGQPNYIVASTWDPFTADLLGTAKDLTEPVFMTLDSGTDGLLDIIRVDAGPRVEDYHLRRGEVLPPV